MTIELKKQIVQELENYLAKHGMSANDFVKKSGVNEGYISNLRNHSFMLNSGNGKMTEISEKWFIKVAEFIGFKLQKEYWQIVHTPQMLRMLATLEDAKEFSYTNVIIGETGCGKTFVTNLFSKNNPLDMFVVTVGSSDNIGDLIDKVLDSIKVPQAKTKSKKLGDIVRFMKNKKLEGFKPMLVFDESEYMKQPALCAMKEFYDNLNGHCAIILIGTNQLISNLDKLRKRNKEGIPQLYRRIKFGIRNLPTIDRSFKPFLNGIEDAGLKRFLVQNCDNYGELHDVLVPAMREAERSGQSLTENFVRTILNMPKVA